MTKGLITIPSSKDALSLPTLPPEMGDVVSQIVGAMGLPPSVIASADQVEAVWQQLPRILSRIPMQHRQEPLARMCVASTVGLFDACINYVWNVSIEALRNRVRTFGLHVVSQIKKQDFDDRKLIQHSDSDLIDLCRELNLLSHDAAFFLHQCREIRNGYSVAHPSGTLIDDAELIAFINRCARFALGDETVPRGVDTRRLLEALKTNSFTQEQVSHWTNEFRGTHDSQRGLLLSMLQGIYCDENESQIARLNSLLLFSELSDEITPDVRIRLVAQHQDYVAKGDPKRSAASRDLFVKIGKLAWLGDAERVGIIYRACRELVDVHRGMNNFYTEVAPARRLREIASQAAIPESAKDRFVYSVAEAGIGNRYGTSWAADESYEAIVSNFSPAEAEVFLDIPNGADQVGGKIKTIPACNQRYARLVALIPSSTIPAHSRAAYEGWSAKAAET